MRSDRLTDLLSQAGTTAIETYGVELHKERAEEAAERLDHVLCGGRLPDIHRQRGLRAAVPESTLRLGAG